MAVVATASGSAAALSYRIECQEGRPSLTSAELVDWAPGQGKGSSLAVQRAKWIDHPTRR
jgi:hypothetical protein